MELHLFRHGETDWNAERRVQGQSESQLSPLGIEQARGLGDRIRPLQFDKIYCSSSVRTRQTAEHAFAHADFDIEYLDSLREIFMGPWEGELYDDIAAREPDSFRHFWHEPHLFQVEGAETFAQLQRRAMDAIAEIFTQHSGQRIAIVSHGALIKSVLCHCTQQALSELWAAPKMHNCAHSIVRFENLATMQVIQYADQLLEPRKGDAAAPG
jgi:broad specificity phosphatase PhoE